MKAVRHLHNRLGLSANAWTLEVGGGFVSAPRIVSARPTGLVRRSPRSSDSRVLDGPRPFMCTMFGLSNRLGIRLILWGMELGSQSSLWRAPVWHMSSSLLRSTRYRVAARFGKSSAVTGCAAAWAALGPSGLSEDLR